MLIRLDQNALKLFVIRRTVWTVLIAALMMSRCHFEATAPQNGSPLVPIVFVGFILLILLAIITLLQWFYCRLLVKSYNIELNPDGIALQYGVISTINELLPFAKIQDILVTSVALERMLGLSSVTIQNAAGQPEKIPGLATDVAESLRDEVLKNIKR